ncbi:MAG: hypothetical protein CR955_01210 [Thiotrichales bacterium]|nr:MAG: hypothetical protein CR955_01210 [Thiotrichales bacterium]
MKNNKDFLEKEVYFKGRDNVVYENIYKLMGIRRLSTYYSTGKLLTGIRTFLLSKVLVSRI